MSGPWKLVRMIDKMEFTLKEGQNTIGRSLNNTIVIANDFISRVHCTISVHKDRVTICGAKNLNGTYVGVQRISENEMHPLKCGDIIGLGVNESMETDKVNRRELLFTLENESYLPKKTLASRIVFEGGTISSASEFEVKNEHNSNSDVISICDSEEEINESKVNRIININSKEFKYEHDADFGETVNGEINYDQIEQESSYIKEEYNLDDDDIECISDSEDDAWAVRLSQSSLLSPGKSPRVLKREVSDDELPEVKLEGIDTTDALQGVENIISDDEDTYSEDLIRIPDIEQQMQDLHRSQINFEDVDTALDVVEVPKKKISERISFLNEECIAYRDSNKQERQSFKEEEVVIPSTASKRKLVEQPTIKSAIQSSVDEIPKKKRKYSKKNKSPSLSASQKAENRKERNKRLKEIAEKEKAEKKEASAEQSSKRPVASVGAKVTNNNRGAFLTDNVSAIEAASISEMKKPTENRISVNEVEKTLRKEPRVSGKIEQEQDPVLQPRTSKSLSHGSKDSSTSNLFNMKERKCNQECTRNNKSLDFAPLPDTHPLSEKYENNKGITGKELRKDKNYDRIRNKEDDGESKKKNTSSSRSRSKERRRNSSVDSTRSSSTSKNESNRRHSKPRKSRDRSNSKSRQRSDSKTRNRSNSKVDPKKRRSKSKDTKHRQSKDCDSSEDSQKRNTTVKISTKPTPILAAVSKSILKKSDDRIPLKDVNPKEPNKIMAADQSKTKLEDPKIKTKKKVSFDMNLNTVKEFEIDPDNKIMKKVSECKASLLTSHFRRLNPDRQFLAFILRWNTKWLEEQIAIKTPPNVLPHSQPPMSMCHSFQNYAQYERTLCDLLLMEVWETVTQDYMRKRKPQYRLEMQLDIPPVISDEKIVPINFSVNLSMPKNSKLPRPGELMMIMIESPEKPGQMQPFKHFCYIEDVRQLLAPRNNVNQFLSVCLVTVNGHSMTHLRRGSRLLGETLCWIKNEMVLMRAVECVRWSPLENLILRPEPKHFVCQSRPVEKSQWTEQLNASQMRAVERSVSAALCGEAAINMIQGPPGTGKSSVICSIIMSYFYCAGKRQNRRKVLVCAKSNAAVDELVIRLLRIRQNLPSSERFRMVRVGIKEAMHPMAYEVSSGKLAVQNAMAARNGNRGNDAAQREVNWLNAKLNSLRNQMKEQTDPAALPELHKRIADLEHRIAMVSRMCKASGDPTRDEWMEEEAKIISGADIIVTTLGSVPNNKLKCLVGQIALCIVDEAAQATEAETLMPLMLGVTRMTLIGDHKQLPGFINSQQAKERGLGDSLFSRLLSNAEDWSDAVSLLDVQYRMHPAISDYPNRAFYSGRVTDSAPPRADLPLRPYALVFIPSEQSNTPGDSCANETEAWGVSRLAAELAAMAQKLKLSVAVITPYLAQRDLIRRNLATLLDKEAQQVEVNTVDSFQGQERDMVVVSLARSQGVGFLTDPGRVNVMLTRARHALFVCLNPHALGRNNQWRSLMDDARRRRSCVELPPRLCRAADPSALRRDPALPLLYKTGFGPGAPPH